MNQYHKIDNVWKRDETSHKLIEGAWKLPEFNYLKNTCWEWTEKVDGTNIRVMWDGTGIKFGGKSDNAQMPAQLVSKLAELFPVDKFIANIPDAGPGYCLYGEGFGAGIQKAGILYSPNKSFVLFDVKVGDCWLERESVEDIGNKLGCQVVPIIGIGTLLEAIGFTRANPISHWGNFPAEGIVARPTVELLNRFGGRIITKIKSKDF